MDANEESRWRRPNDITSEPAKLRRPRWYMPTPGKFVSLLLLSVVALYLSDQYDWFAFNRQKGWTVLIAMAIVSRALFC